MCESVGDATAGTRILDSSEWLLAGGDAAGGLVLGEDFGAGSLT